MVSKNQPVKSLTFSFDVNLAVRVKKAAPPLYWTGLALLALSMPTLALTLFDARQFQGVSVWLKPFKFQLSIGVYMLTLALFMVWLPTESLHTKTARYVVWTAVLSGLYEVAYITFMGGQGLASHFNTQTSLLAVMYILMGVGAVTLTSSSLILGILVTCSPAYALPPAIKLAAVLGLTLTFVMGTTLGGYLSSQPTGHWVGGALTDHGGLPLVAWSRSGGDLRVAHFFGIHAMHFIPAFALALGLAGITQARAVRAVWIFAVIFTGFCIWTFFQARNGLPFLG